MIAGFVAYLSRYGSQWATPVLYGLVAFLLVLGISLLFRLPALIQASRQSDVTPVNIESKIRAWADYFGLATQKVTNQEAYFAIIITMKSGRQIVVARTKDHRDRYLTFQSVLALTDEHKEMFRTLTPSQAQDLFDEISLEAARARVNYEIKLPLETIIIGKVIPIRGNLSALDFGSALDDIESGLEIFRSAIRLGLGKRH